MGVTGTAVHYRDGYEFESRACMRGKEDVVTLVAACMNRVVTKSSSAAHQSFNQCVGEHFVHDAAALGEHALDSL